MSDHCKLHTSYNSDCHRCREIKREHLKYHPEETKASSDDDDSNSPDYNTVLTFEAESIALDTSTSDTSSQNSGQQDSGTGFDSNSFSGGDFGGGGAGGDFNS